MKGLVISGAVLAFCILCAVFDEKTRASWIIDCAIWGAVCGMEVANVRERGAK